MSELAIRAIETAYAGCRFRSRLEARWAVFFDTLGIRWEYEPQGFELAPIPAASLDERYLCSSVGAHHNEHLGAYLPDFWLPAQKAWFEVKGAEPSRAEWTRLDRFMVLAELAGQRFFIAVGGLPNPDLFSGEIYDHAFNGDGLHIRTFCPGACAWTACHSCGFLDIQQQGLSSRAACTCPQPSGDEWGMDDRSIVRAYAAARSARFERGESPRPRVRGET